MRQYFLVSEAQRACHNAPGELQVATVSAVTKAYRFAKGHSGKSMELTSTLDLDYALFHA